MIEPVIEPVPMSATELYPAIDLRAGRCVRLMQGDFERETVYGDDPVSVARGYEMSGARWVHVVDLDAARTGEQTNLDAVRSVCAGVGCSIEVGGGIRSVDAAQRLLDSGVARVVVGTAAVEDPELVDDLCARFPGQVAVGLDARGREVAVRGWTESSGAELVELARRFDEVGVAALIVTEIGRDGTMDGPDLDQLAAVLEATLLPVMASGGVGSLDDVRSLVALGARVRPLAGVIVGRALYEGRFSVEEAVACLQRG